MAANIKNIGTATLRANEGLILSGSVNTEEGHTLVVTGTMKISAPIHDKDDAHITANELVAVQKTYTILHDADPASDGSLVYVMMNPSLPSLATFVTAESGASLWNNYSESEHISVQYQSEPPAIGAIQLYVDYDGASDEKYIANMGGMDLKVPTSTGRIIHIKHNADASSVGVPLYFDMQAASARTRMIADVPNDTNIATTTSEEYSWLFKPKP